MSQSIKELRSRHFPPHGASRRRLHHGVAVARIASRVRRHSVAVRIPEAVRRRLPGKRHQRGSLERRRPGRRHEAQQDAGAAGAAEAEDQRDRRPVREGADRPGHSSRADRKSAVGRAHLEGRHHPLRHQRGSDDRQPRRPGHPAIQHRAGLRAADDRLPRDELLDGLQFAHLVAESGFARAGGSLSVAGLGQPVRESRQPAEYQHSRPREGSRPGLSAGRSARPTKASWTNI